MNREAIYAALFAKLSSAAGFVTKSRKLAHWNDVPPVNQPAIFQAQKGETAQTVRGQPTRWTMTVDVYIYVHVAGDETASTKLNALLDAVTATLAPTDPSNAQTLGGLVHHCWIDGQIETDEGTLGDQAVCIIPISIVTT